VSLRAGFKNPNGERSGRTQQACAARGAGQSVKREGGSVVCDRRSVFAASPHC
jgi:hypothetical protein